MSSEKQFVLKDVFKNIKSIKESYRKYGGEQEFFGLAWQTSLRKDSDSYSLEIWCYVESENWSVDTELEFRLIGKKVLTSKGYYTFDLQCSNYDEFLTIKESQIGRYLIDGNLTVECHVKILKAEGVKGMKSRFEGESMRKYSDVVLVVDGEKFYVSKAYLASRSSYFDTLLMGQFKESNQSEVVLHGIEVEDFQNYLEVLYAETVTNDQNVESVLHVADMYETKCVIKQAEEFLLKISNKSKKEKFGLAVKYSLENLKDSILSQPLCAAEIRSLLPDDLTQFDNGTMAELFRRYLSATTTSHFPITVKTVTDKQFEIYVESTDTIISLKSKIAEKKDIPPQQQRFTFNGRQLEDGKTLGEYKIKINSIIYLVPRLS